MPEFDTYVDVDVDDFVSACNKKEIQELIDTLIEDGHLPSTAIKATNLGPLETFFVEKMDNLKTCYYRISPEDEKTLENLFKKYL
jgi:hypothetical protein